MMKLKRLMETREIDDLCAHPISREINSKKADHNRPEVQEPFEYEELRSP